MQLSQRLLEKYNVCKSKTKAVEEFLLKHNITKISAVPYSIIMVITHDHDFTELIDRYELIKTFGKDSCSLASNIARYGPIVGLVKFKSRQDRLSVTSSKQRQVEKFGEDAYLKMRKSIGLQTMIERHGEVAGNIKWLEYLNKFKHSHTQEGRIEKLGAADGAAHHETIINKHKKSNSKNGYIEKHGLEKGTTMWYNKNAQIKYKNSREYYIEKYGDDFKEILRKAKDNISLQSHIDRLGEIEGTRLYNERIKKFSDYAKENKSVLHFNPENFYSKISQQFCKDLHFLMGDIKCMYGENGGEYFIYNKETKNIYFYDFIYNNKIIEFNGDYWHKNPRFYADAESALVREKDAIKKQVAIDSGKNLLVIWEYDYYKNPTQTLQTALNFLQDEHN